MKVIEAQAQRRYVESLEADVVAELQLLSGKSEKEIRKFLPRFCQARSRSEQRAEIQKIYREPPPALPTPPSSQFPSFPFDGPRKPETKAGLNPWTLKTLFKINSVSDQIMVLAEDLRIQRSLLDATLARDQRRLEAARAELARLERQAG